MFNSKQKRLLSIDGGGILGLISIQILKEIEAQLRVVSGVGEDFRLRDYFDYIGGTSTGAIIAAGLSLGKSVAEMEVFYTERGEEMFRPASLLKRYRHKYDHEALSKLLQNEFYDMSIAQLQDLGALSKEKHLLVVTRNIETDSPWPISSNPAAKYNNLARSDCNLNIPLWQLVRASTAAPIYFAPEKLQWDPKDSTKHFYFEDGGVTPYNNPALLLYKMATQPQYGCGWPLGEDLMMMVSVGTGNSYRLMKDPNPDGEGLISTAGTIPGEIMRGISAENDINCRIFGRCVAGSIIDSEHGDMIVPHDPDRQKTFLYARFDPDTSQNGLDAAGLGDIDSKNLALDKVEAIHDMIRVGKVASKAVNIKKQFSNFLN